MRTTKILKILVLSVGLIFCLVDVSNAKLMGTAFTYQGRLIDTNSAADGLYDFQFRLYYGPTDVNQAGVTVDVIDLDVIDGYFTAELDFGSAVFDGNSVWLEIDVRPGDSNDPNAFLTLSPRQEVTPMPYALQTRGIFVDNAENVGIGTTTPKGKLDVDGGKANLGLRGTNIKIEAQDGGDGGGLFGDNGGNGGNIILLPGEGGEPRGLGIPGRPGNVGIGTTKPNFDLDVAGHINFTGNLYQNGSLFPGGGSLWTASGSDIYFNAGNVGIGTDSPTAKLHSVSSDSTAIYGYCSGENNYSGFFSGGMGMCIFGTDEMGGHLLLRGLGAFPITDNWGTIEFKDLYNNLKGSITSRTTLIGHVLLLGAGEDIQMCIYNNNRVGIGTFLPVGQLGLGDYQGGTVGSAVAGHEKQLVLAGDYNTGFNTGSSVKLLISDYDNDTGADIYPIYCEDENNKVDFYVRKQEGEASTAYFGGNVGIGTKEPAGKLDIRSSTGTSCMFVVSEGTSVNAWFSVSNTSGGQAIMATSNSDLSPAVRISNTGNGGALSVDGTAQVDVLEITGADVAEKFPVTEEVKPGMVLAIDSEHPGKLCLARGAYNRCVAGIVSGANGLPAGAVLGNLPGQEESMPVALSGRVWVYCDATEQPVEPGDLLTTAERSGYAMSVTDYQRAQGAVIGKAMTRLEKGNTDLVLVLVNLQ